MKQRRWEAVVFRGSIQVPQRWKELGGRWDWTARESCTRGDRPALPPLRPLLLRALAERCRRKGGGGPMLYLSFISLVTLLVMRPHRRPPKKRTQTLTMITDKK